MFDHAVALLRRLRTAMGAQLTIVSAVARDGYGHAARHANRTGRAIRGQIMTPGSRLRFTVFLCVIISSAALSGYAGYVLNHRTGMALVVAVTNAANAPLTVMALANLPRKRQSK